MTLGDFHFIRPMWLLLIPVAVWLWYRLRESADQMRGWRAVMEPEFLEAMQVGGARRDWWREYARLVVWLLAIVAVAGPTWKPEPSPFADNPVAVMILLRADATMDQADLLPSRMERARLKVTDLANARKGKPLGLLAYAGSAHLVLPPTRDTSVVASMAAEISPDVMPKMGDNLTGAIRLASRTLGEQGGLIAVIADNAQALSEKEVAALDQANIVGQVQILAIARDDTPELTAIGQVARQLDAAVTVMSADDSDIQALVTATAKAPVMLNSSAGRTQWAESGWWLVPILVSFCLASFRRVDNRQEVRA